MSNLGISAVTRVAVKRLAIALPIVLLLSMLSSCLSILAQPTHIPHENPATAIDSPDPASLLLFYANIFDLAAIRQYQDAQSMLNRLEYANIPDELRYLIDHFSTLSRRLFTTLDNLEAILDEASTLLAHNQISEVKQMLDTGDVAIRDALLLLKDIETASNTLDDRLDVFAAPASSRIRLTDERFEQMLHRMKQLTDEFNQVWQSLTEEYEFLAVELIPTELSLNITPAAVFVGDSITASGRLIGDNSPLAKRELTLLLDNEPLVITTDPDGSYVTDIAIPYRYVSTMTLEAVYTPSEYDIDTYLASVSRPVVVSASFYPTLLEVSAPETAQPGLTITISGQVTSTDGTIGRTVKVLLDNSQLAQETTQGQFSIEVTVPQQLSSGKHSLTVVATPQERYSGASKRLIIDISRLPIQADIQLPLLSIIPKSIQVSGKVYHSLGPVRDASVSLRFRDSSTTVKTSTDGSFSINIGVPFSLSLVGPQELGITIEPVEVGYTSLQIKKWILIVNPAYLGLILAAFISVGVVLFKRARAKPVRPREEMVTAEAKRLEAAKLILLPTAKYEHSGINGRILSAYLSGLVAVEKTTSVVITPYTTLREFLKAVISSLSTVTKPFSELTTIAEIALYSAHDIDEDIATKAEQLGVIIEEELHSGAA